MFLERGCNKKTVKTMATEYWLLLLFVAIVATVYVVNKLHETADETAEKVFWANRNTPLIYEQTDFSSKAETIAAYERALEMLEKHGNKFLGKTREQRAANVFLWVHGADKSNTASDFSEWQYLNIARRAAIHEAFRALKANNAQAAERLAEAAKVFAGQEQSN